jgi:hypothetical protein
MENLADYVSSIQHQVDRMVNDLGCFKRDVNHLIISDTTSVQDQGLPSTVKTCCGFWSLDLDFSEVTEAASIRFKPTMLQVPRPYTVNVTLLSLVWPFGFKSTSNCVTIGSAGCFLGSRTIAQSWTFSEDNVDIRIDFHSGALLNHQRVEILFEANEMEYTQIEHSVNFISSTCLSLTNFGFEKVGLSMLHYLHAASRPGSRIELLLGACVFHANSTWLTVIDGPSKHMQSIFSGFYVSNTSLTVTGSAHRLLIIISTNLLSQLTFKGSSMLKCRTELLFSANESVISASTSCTEPVNVSWVRKLVDIIMRRRCAPPVTVKLALDT